MPSDAISRAAIASVYAVTGSRPVSHSATRSLMGGTSTLTVVGGPSNELDALWRLADRCEQLWSRFRSDSDLSVLNAAGGAPVRVDALTIRLLRAMQAGRRVTGGDFDPTLLPALLAEGYVASVIDPSRTSTVSALATWPGDVEAVDIDAAIIRLPAGTTLDSGGIGKGLAADVLCELALADGALGVMAEISGDIVVAGQSPQGNGWVLGIVDPFDESRHLATVRLESGALVTSSRLKRRWQAGGVTTHHLIDPRTGHSAVTEVATVSVIAGTGAHAEVLTKPGFLRDTGEYLAWLPTVNAAGLIVRADGTTATSENWEQYR